MVLWLSICAVFLFALYLSIGIEANRLDIKYMKEDVSALDKRISGNAIAADATLNKAEENARKIREILERMKGKIP